MNDIARSYGKTSLQKTKSELNDIARRFRAFRDLRKKEHMLKIEMKNKIDLLSEELDELEEVLPKKEEKKTIMANTNPEYKMNIQEWNKVPLHQVGEEEKEEEKEGLLSFILPKKAKKSMGSVRKKSKKTLLKEEIEEIKERLKILRESLEQ